jgi:hypothetical protein
MQRDTYSDVVKFVFRLDFLRQLFYPVFNKYTGLGKTIKKETASDDDFIPDETRADGLERRRKSTGLE